LAVPACYGSPSINDRCTAGFSSIDSFPEDAVPTFCLPFDGIGARHLGMAGTRCLGIAHFISHSWKSTTYPRYKPRIADDPADQKASGETRFPACRSHRPNRPMPGCRTPIQSKSKQRFGAVLCGKVTIYRNDGNLL